MEKAMTNAQRAIVKYINQNFVKASVLIEPMKLDIVRITDTKGEQMTFTVNLYTDIMDAKTNRILAESDLSHDMMKNPISAIPNSWNNKAIIGFGKMCDSIKQFKTGVYSLDVEGNIYKKVPEAKKQELNDGRDVGGDRSVYQYRDKRFTREQFEVICRGENAKLTEEQIKAFARPELSSAQMEELRCAVQDGLSKEQIKIFAKPEIPSWQMDFCRIGMQHGVSYQELQPILSNQKSTWAEKRNDLGALLNEKRAVIAKDLKQNGFSSDKKIVRKIEKFNHITKRQNTVKDIADAYVRQSYSNSNPEAQEAVNDLGRELRTQEISKASEAAVMEM